MSTKKLQILGSFGSSDADTVDGKHASDFASTSDIEELETQLSELKSRLEELDYEPINIKGFYFDTVDSLVSERYAEIGSTVDELILSWELSKTPTTQSINSDAVDVDARSTTVANVSEDTTFTLLVTDSRNATDDMDVNITFCNYIYWGLLSKGATLDSDATLSWNKRLQPTKEIYFSVWAQSGQQIAYALPSRLGTPAFKVGSFVGGFYLAKTIELTNSSDYAENYDIWLSDEAGLGMTGVEVIPGVESV